MKLSSHQHTATTESRSSLLIAQILQQEPRHQRRPARRGNGSVMTRHVFPSINAVMVDTTVLFARMNMTAQTTV